ncbi:MAG: 6,7-dimethyl-8-ribityllumazine synthase [Rhodospirillaceae bacterium]
MSLQGKRVLLVCAPYYPDIVNAMIEGSKPVLDAAGVGHHRIDVPGVFELPMAVKMLSQQTDKYDGFIAFGCVIRGETDHYDHICREASRALMDLTVVDGLALGFGVLTCETVQQAIVRADPKQKNKGAEAAKACVAMMALKLGGGTA